ncbi:MAG: OmpA family protein [Hoylesella enoeca]|uniref:OmpA family protein n=1 Tax=Hoylesella enoeca TaxID=76123 RepID=UPI00288A2408|nr:OmpA family protein [Hoylesella enoeca]
MNKRRTKPLIPPLSGRWARVGLCVLFSATIAAGAQAQNTEEGRTQPPQDQNSELRTRTWSIYAEGGLSWATDVWYQNLNAKRSYKQSPAVGGGIDFTIRPWVRVGAEYLWSRYRREQRFSTLDTKTMPVKVYGNYLMNYHNAKLGLGFNFMELWPRRCTQWLNIWLSTGIGYTFARDNEYAITFSNTKTQGGKTTPIGEGENIGNESSVTVVGNVRTTNHHEHFNKLYIPASLHIEADISRRFTIGLKGEMDWVLNRKTTMPESLLFGLATLRYNFVASRAKVLTKYYTGEIDALNDRINTLQRETETEQARANRAEADKTKLRQESEELQRRLNDCQNSKTTRAQRPSFVVRFNNDSHVLTPKEAKRLKLFAQVMMGHKFSIVAEASTPGTDEHNQRLSERRLQSVVNVLRAEGIVPADIEPQTAIGARNGIATAEGRKVTINIKD